MSSFSAHFRLVGLTAKAHFELIFGSSVGRPKLILSSFLAHRFDGRNSFGAHFELIFGSLARCEKLILRSFRSCSDVIFGSSVARFLGANFFCTEGVQILSLPKLVESG